MGLHGPHARRKPKPGEVRSKPRKRRPPWRKPGLSRVNRVCKFLETLPITKGVLAGKKMKLLPGQRKFIKATVAPIGLFTGTENLDCRLSDRLAAQ